MKRRQSSRRRGIVLVLVMAFLIVLAILASAFFLFTRGVRRSTRFNYHRLQANAGLENTLMEGRMIFLQRVNQAPATIPAAKGVRKTFKSRRRDEVTERNRAAFRRFMNRHTRPFEQHSQRLDSDDETVDESMFERPLGKTKIPADAWYEAFRNMPDEFDVELRSPFAARLMAGTCRAIRFTPVQISILSQSTPGHDAKPGTEVEGVLALRTEIFVRGDMDTFRRSMEQRYRYRVVKPPPPPKGQGIGYREVERDFFT